MERCWGVRLPKPPDPCLHLYPFLSSSSLSLSLSTAHTVPTFLLPVEAVICPFPLWNWNCIKMSGTGYCLRCYVLSTQIPLGVPCPPPLLLLDLRNDWYLQKCSNIERMMRSSILPRCKTQSLLCPTSTSLFLPSILSKMPCCVQLWVSAPIVLNQVEKYKNVGNSRTALYIPLSIFSFS